MNKDFKKLTVKNVRQFLSGYEPQHAATVQQVLEWFGQARKLERITWALLKRHELDGIARSERVKVHGNSKEEEGMPPSKETVDHDEIKRVYSKAKKKAVDLPPMKTVVGLCSRCGSKVMGEPQRSCSKRANEPVFYKECSSCGWYSEVWRYGNKYKEVEGG